MSKLRVIRKYPNRRLYDIEESRYITIEDVHRLVVKQVEFKVIDRRDDTDVTRVVLLQVIADLERKGVSLLVAKPSASSSAALVIGLRPARPSPEPPKGAQGP